MDYIKDNYDYIKLPKKQIISMEVEPYSYDSIPTYTITFKGAPIMSSNIKNTTTMIVDDINKNKMEGKTKTMELLRLYKENEIAKIDKKYDEEMDELLAIDKFVIKAKEYNKFIEENTNKIYERIDEEKVLEETTIKERDTIIDKMKSEKRKLNNLIDMLECHLELAQTFEEKQNLLKLYGIVNEEGKLKTFIDDEEEINYEEIVEREVKKCKKLN